MTFTLVAHTCEQLSTILQDRMKKKKAEEAEQERKAVEVGVIPSAHFQGLTDSYYIPSPSIDSQEEEAKTRGTPVTLATFMAWRVAFSREQAAIKVRSDEEKLAKMTSKEREEWKRTQARLSGRQLFEKGGDQFGEEDVETGPDADAREVDASLFERVRASEREDENEEKSRVVLDDSD